MSGEVSEDRDILDLETARRWIGCALILKEDYREFKAGTHCIVSCTVDYGDDDGLLLWIDTNDDDGLLREVDQFDFATFKRLFRTMTPVADRSASARIPARRWLWAS